MSTIHNMNSSNKNYMKFNLASIVLNFTKLTVKYHNTSSIFGFFIIMTLILQIVSGILLSFSLVPEPMLIPIVRDEEDIEVPYIDLIF